MVDDGKRRWSGPKTGRGATSGRRGSARQVTAHRASSESSKRWIERQLQDPYVRQAQREGFRARSAYKLKEIDDKVGLLRAGQRVIDLGAAPGGWLQVVQDARAREVAGIDLIEIEPLGGVHLVCGDVGDDASVAALLDGLSAPPDLVLSDMAANTTGHRQTDHLRTVALVELALDFALDHLAPQGAFVAKVFQGGATGEVLVRLKAAFASVRHVKPPASRQTSPEIYVVAQGYRPQTGGG